MLIFFYSGLMCYFMHLSAEKHKVWNYTSGVKTLLCLRNRALHSSNCSTEKAVRKSTMGEWICVSTAVQLHDSCRKVQFSHQTTLAILPPVMAVGIELILQTKTSFSYKESNFKLCPVPRSFSNYQKGHLLPNHHLWSWSVSVWKKKGK